MTTFAILRNQVCYSFLGLYFMVVTMTVTLFQPYKRKIYNRIDTVLFTLLSMVYLVFTSAHFTTAYEPQFKRRHIFNPISIIVVSLSAFYGYYVFLKNFIPKKMFTITSKCYSYLCRERNPNNVQSVLRDRADEQTPLLHNRDANH